MELCEKPSKIAYRVPTYNNSYGIKPIFASHCPKITLQKAKNYHKSQPTFEKDSPVTDIWITPFTGREALSSIIHYEKSMHLQIALPLQNNLIQIKRNFGSLWLPVLAIFFCLPIPGIVN